MHSFGIAHFSSKSPPPQSFSTSSSPLLPSSPTSPRAFSFPLLSPSSTSSSIAAATPRTIAHDGFSSLRRSLLTKDVIDELTVPKNRRPRFELALQIHDLNNIPLTAGVAYVKWHISGSAKRETHGQTDRASIKDHKVFWNYKATCGVRMTIDRNNMLSETNLVFQIIQEFPTGGGTGGNGGREERMNLGFVNLNLAEYAKVESETRRYLMQESKINSTLKVTVQLTQISGDTTFLVPKLKSAHIFGAITGVINEQTPTDGSVGSGKDDPISGVPSANISLSHLHYTTSLKDMYRETLASQWQTQPDELSAEECIEDIFSGGDGWKGGISPSRRSEEEEGRRAYTHHKSGSRSPSSSSSSSSSSRERHSNKSEPPSRHGSIGGKSLSGHSSKSSSQGSTSGISMHISPPTPISGSLHPTSASSTTSSIHRNPSTSTTSTTNSYSTRPRATYNDDPVLTSIFSHTSSRLPPSSTVPVPSMRWKSSTSITATFTHMEERKVISRSNTAAGRLGLGVSLGGAGASSGGGQVWRGAAVGRELDELEIREDLRSWGRER